MTPCCFCEEPMETAILKNGELYCEWCAALIIEDDETDPVYHVPDNAQTWDEYEAERRNTGYRI